MAFPQNASYEQALQALQQIQGATLGQLQNRRRDMVKILNAIFTYREQLPLESLVALSENINFQNFVQGSADPIRNAARPVQLYTEQRIADGMQQEEQQNQQQGEQGGQLQEEVVQQNVQQPAVQLQNQQLDRYTLNQYNAIATWADIDYDRLRVSIQNGVFQYRDVAAKTIQLYLLIDEPQVQNINFEQIPALVRQSIAALDANRSVQEFLAICITSAILGFKSVNPLTVDQYTQFINTRMDILRRVNNVEHARINALPYMNLLIGKFNLLQQEQRATNITAYRFNQLIIKNLNDIIIDRPTLLTTQKIKQNKKIIKIQTAIVGTGVGDTVVLTDQLAAYRTAKYGYVIRHQNGSIYYPGRKFVQSVIYPLMNDNNKQQMKNIIERVMEMAASNQQMKYEKYVKQGRVKIARKYEKVFENKGRYSDVVKEFFRPRKIKQPDGTYRYQYTTIPADTEFRTMADTAADLKSQRILANANNVRQFRLNNIQQLRQNIGGTNRQLQNFIDYHTKRGINQQVRNVQNNPMVVQNVDQDQLQRINEYRVRQ